MDDYYFEEEKLQITECGIEVFSVSGTGKQCVSVPHMHSSVEILFCTEGSLRVNLDGENFDVKNGEMIMLRSNTIHTINLTDDGENTYHVVKVKLSLILDFTSKKNQLIYLLSFVSRDKAVKTVWHQSECSNIFQTLKIILDEHNNSEYGSDIAIKINVFSILLQILRDTKNDNKAVNESGDLVKRIYETTLYINEHYQEDISAKDLCSKASLSYNYFSSVFKRITGTSFKEYLIKTRITHAEQELLSTDKSITDIAATCGFNNTSYFIVNFKRFRNITPLELRKSQSCGSTISHSS